MLERSFWDWGSVWKHGEESLPCTGTNKGHPEGHSIPKAEAKDIYLWRKSRRK